MKPLRGYKELRDLVLDLIFLWEFEHRRTPLPQRMYPSGEPGAFLVGWNPTQGIGQVRLEFVEGQVLAHLEHKDHVGVWAHDPEEDVCADLDEDLVELYDRLGNACFFEALHYALTR